VHWEHFSPRSAASVDFVDIPTIVSQFAHETEPAPRSIVERLFIVEDWIEHPGGGHFAAWEQPEAYAADPRLAIGLAG
jgi:hypothetical protein